MDERREVRDFLVSRRAKITPEQAGLPAYGGNRRVAGLRREEVAMLAGVSADYYTKVERGNLHGVSESVLDAIARALQLDEAERTHLFDLARAANQPTRLRRTSPRRGLRPGLQRILDAMSSAPAYVRNGRYDILATNRLGRALFDESFPAGAESFNLARYLFLDQRARDYYLDWEVVARDCVASLRAEAGRAPYDRTLTDLIGELVTRSDEFRTWWAAHNVKLHRTATKHVHHSIAGEMTLTGEALAVPGDDGLTIIVYTVEPNSESELALRFLDSWADQRQAQPSPSKAAE